MSLIEQSRAVEQAGASLEATVPAARRPKARRSAAWRENVEGYLFISPWLIGFLIFTLGPMAYSLYLSFTRYDPRGAKAPAWIGLKNYEFALTNADGRFYDSLVATFTYAVVSIPLMLVASLAVALLLSQKMRGIGVFRTIFYLPAVLPSLAVAMVFYWLFNRDYGLINMALASVGAQPIDWLGNPRFVQSSYVIATLWGVGGGMMVLIAAIKGIPPSYYEAATLDGANWWHRFRYITVPQLSFVLYYNLVMGIIGAFQVFDLAFVMGGAGTSDLFYVLYLYQNAWMGHKMGYASALAWILFGIILAISLAVVKSSPMWVYYEGEKRS